MVIPGKWYSGLLFCVIFTVVSLNSVFSQNDSIPSSEKQEKSSGEFQYDYYENPELAKIIEQLETQYMKKNELPSAIDVFLKAVILHEHKSITLGSNIENLGWVLIDIGNSFYNMQDYLFAEKVFEKALFLFIQAKSDLGTITSINNIGLCKLNLSEPENALQVFEKMLVFSTEVNDSSRIYASTVYIGMSLRDAGKYNEAIQTFNSLEIFPNKKIEKQLIQLKNLELGDTYLKLKLIDSAYTYYTRALANNIESETYYSSFGLVKMAKIELEYNNINKAIQLSEKAYNMIDSEQYKSLKASACKILYHCYKKKGNDKLALKYFEEFQNLNNDLNKKEIRNFVDTYNRKLERIGIKHELNEIRKQKNEAIAERHNQQNLAVFLVIMAILLVVSIFGSRNFYSRTNILFNHVESYTPWHKVILSISFLIYFTTFNYLFVPLGNAMEIRQLEPIYRLIPGIISFLLSSAFFVLFTITQQARKKAEQKENPYTYYIIATLFITTCLLQYFYFNSLSFGGINFLLSLTIIVFASFIVPLYAFILLVENVILRQIENISKSLNQDISDINTNYFPKEKTVSIASEKTKGKLNFNISSLISIEAKGNYCMFNFDEGDRLSTEMLHITMKSIEEHFSEFENIIRCHKSFFANIYKIEKVSGNSRGYFLRLKHCTESMPVSRGYQKSVMAKIREAKAHLS